MKAGDCLDHQASNDLKRETPIKGSIIAEAIETTLKTLKTVGERVPAAATQSAIPNAKRIADAAHKPLLDCQLDTKPTRAAGAIKPKTPMPPANSETAMTISSLTFISLP